MTSVFGQQQQNFASFVHNSTGVVPNYAFPSSFPSNPTNFTEVRPMKRYLEDPNYVSEFSPTEKKALYEKRISDSFGGIQLGGDSSSNSPLVVEQQENDDFIEIPEIETDQFVDEPLVEEPEDEFDVSLSDELRYYIQSMKNVPLIPQKHKKGNELVLYNPADEIKSRITEVIDDDAQLDDLDLPEVSAPSSDSSQGAANSVDEETMEVDESMDID
ncbi:hypothetical protein M3Y98_01082900 [Aphelenchoides besseyi]|nr:hypothetical protein M3Y98_01082900 [Aphelenchoides besseyi]KAI6209489.1 hypothetical protein M3Y96_00226700 [Aphelenchoides besseyi]